MLLNIQIVFSFVIVNDSVVCIVHMIYSLSDFPQPKVPGTSYYMKKQEKVAIDADC